MIGDNESNFLDKSLLTSRQVANFCKAFANYLSTVIKLPKTQLSKMVQSEGFLGRLLGPLLKTALPLTKNMIKPLVKTVLISLGLTATASTAGIHKKILGSRHSHSSTTTVIISNDEMEDIIKIVKSLEDSSLLLKGGSETTQNEANEQKGGLLSMLLGTLGANLLGNILNGQGIKRAGEGREINRAGEGIVRAGYGNKKGRKNEKMDF